MASYFLKEFLKVLQLPKVAPMPYEPGRSHNDANRLRAFANSTQGVKILQLAKGKPGR
jgi:hypothetical protein